MKTPAFYISISKWKILILFDDAKSHYYNSVLVWITSFFFLSMHKVPCGTMKPSPLQSGSRSLPVMFNHNLTSSCAVFSKRILTSISCEYPKELARILNCLTDMWNISWSGLQGYIPKLAMILLFNCLYFKEMDYCLFLNFTFYF